MRGRDFFKLVRPLLRIVRAILLLFPRPFCEVFFVLIRHLPTRLGVALRYAVLSRLSRSCGDNVAMFEGSYILRAGRMDIGDNVSIHPMCYIDATGGLKIGNDVSIAHATTIMTTEHYYSNINTTIRDAEAIYAPVEIGNNVWIGAGVRVLSGVRIGSESVVGAGAVVTSDVPPHSLVAGVPARKLKEIRKTSDEPATCF
jgi:acetyltransferase-like isoleucine patch superfamily enzyme